MQIINDPGLGTLLGNSLGTGLQQLAQQKLGELQQRQKAAGFQNIGIPQQEAQLLSSLSPQELKSLGPILENYLTAPQQQITSTGLQELAQQQSPQYKSPTPFQLLMGQLNPQTNQLAPGQQFGEEQPQLSSAEAPQQIQPTKATHRPLTIAEAKRQTSEEKEALKELRKAGLKETAKLRADLSSKAAIAKERLKDLGRLEELEKEGKLDTPGYVEFLKRSGFDIPALMNEGSQEFSKIVANFVNGAKESFGSRISNFELESFLKTLPNLSQSPEGRKRVIANLKNINRAAIEYNEAKKEILKEHHGLPPIDLADEIDDRIGKRLDNISKKFREDLAKPVPKGQNKFITALQALAGSTLSVPGKILGKAGSLIGGGSAPVPPI